MLTGNSGIDPSDGDHDAKNRKLNGQKIGAGKRIEPRAQAVAPRRQSARSARLTLNPFIICLIAVAGNQSGVGVGVGKRPDMSQAEWDGKNQRREFRKSELAS